jgi:predicted ATPase
VFSNAGGRARGKTTVHAFAANATAAVVAEYKSALHGLTVRGKPAVVAALLANHPDDILSIELNTVVQTSGYQTIVTSIPPIVSGGQSNQRSQWGLDRIDQVCAHYY